MPIHKAEFECPECEKMHTVTFEFYRPENCDEDYENVKCSCGCEFDAYVQIEVKYEYMEFHPEITKSGKTEQATP